MNTDFFGTIDRTSYFSNLNAGVKLIVSFTLIIAALIVRDPLTSGILFALELLGFILVGFRPVNVLARFWPILIAVITTGWSVAMLSAKSGTTILDLGFNSITTDSAAVGAAMMIRSLAMVLPTLAFVLTTDPTDLGDSLAQTFKLPSRFVLATVAALRLVGILFAEWNALGQARRARGLGAGQSLAGRAQTFGGRSFAPRVQANWQRLDRGKKQIKAGAEEKKLYDDFMQSAYRAALTTDFDYDLRKMKLLAPYWAKHHRLKAQPDFVREDMNAYFDSLYSTTDFRDTAEINTYMATDYFEAFYEDPVISHWLLFDRLIDEVYRPALDRYERKLAELNQIYVRGLCEMYGWTKAPDANSTLRMTYGSVRGYSPRDAVQYGWRTGLKGMFEKENPADPDYVVDEKLRQHYLAKNYGPYADADGELPTCFLTNNDITGGNSGSAVLNARGELIGLAFDGNIESLSSDLRYNPQLQRCINADIRYILFVIDTYGGSHYLLNEMEIRR